MEQKSVPLYYESIACVIWLLKFVENFVRCDVIVLFMDEGLFKACNDNDNHKLPWNILCNVIFVAMQMH